MTVSKKLRFLLLLGAIGLGSLGFDGDSVVSNWSWRVGIVSTAHAEVGRPLTPVSVAGVARRSARRCDGDC